MKSLYASVLRLNSEDSLELGIKDTYSLHRVVYGLFDESRTEKQKASSMSSGIQWVDKGADARCRQVLILSDRLPKKNSSHRALEVESKALPKGFLEHSRYRFEVVINPSRLDFITKKRVPIKGRAAITRWFIERARINWGFSVNPRHFRVGCIHVVKFTAKHSITLQQAKLTGYLTVKDPVVFAKSVAAGLGRSRSFGCGLLQVVPVLESSLL